MFYYKLFLMIKTMLKKVTENCMEIFSSAIVKDICTDIYTVYKIHIVRQYRIK